MGHTRPQNEDPECADSVIKAARATHDIYDTNQGGDIAVAHLARGHSRRVDSSRSHSHSSASTEFDWTNTKNRTDICYHCGLPGHFAQYCVSIMPEDVRHRIIRSRECAQFAKDESSDSDTDAAHVAATAFTTNSHIAAATVDLPFEINIDTMDPTICESVFGALSAPYPPPSPLADQSPTPTSPTLTASISSIAETHTASTSSTAGTPKKKKKKKKKRPPAEVALERTSLNEVEEGECSM
ncbi:hypothetical protein B0H13DRAFT_1850890 [Mycena leptocephala]|nr:hypothetical protein B0H13DRAFT_1850890 [Mycena leptocephala]